MNAKNSTIDRVAEQEARQRMFRQEQKLAANMARHASGRNYCAVEIVSRGISTDIGDITEQEEAERGTTNLSLGKKVQLTTTQMKSCLANFVPGLVEATRIVHIPTVMLDGTPLDAAEWQQALYSCRWYDGKEWVPVWTQSSVKSTTFYFIERQMFEKLAAEWNVRKDGARFSSYIGLLFSEMDGSRVLSIPTRAVGPGTGMPDAIAKGYVYPLKGASGIEWDTNQWKFGAEKLGIPAPKDGRDGNCPADPSLIGSTGSQFRAMHLSGSNEIIVMLNHDVSAKLRKMWVSCEPTVMLRDTPLVRRFLSARVYREVSDYVAILTDPVALLRRWGGLNMDKHGNLEQAKQAVISALRSNTPMCAEIENRIARFAVDEITTKIIPSGAVWAWSSKLVISDSAGVEPCGWGKAKCFAVRIPSTGAPAVVPLPEFPFVKGKGMVVTSEVASRVDGDADSDDLEVVDEETVVKLYARFLNRKITHTGKPDKQRSEKPLTVDYMYDTAVNLVNRNWEVGALTVAGWKMIQEKRFSEASQCLWAANAQPMTQKWDIVVNGDQFSSYVRKLYGQMSDDLKKINLRWRDMAKTAAEWRSPRELANATIADPASHLDFCWNAAVEAVKKFDVMNPKRLLSMSEVAVLTFKYRQHAPTGRDWYEARQMFNWWGEYWTPIIKAGATGGDYSKAYEKALNWGRHADAGALAALLQMRSKTNPESSGFGLKWWAVYASGRAVEVIGMRPSVAQELKSLRGKYEELLKQEALVEALLDTIK